MSTRWSAALRPKVLSETNRHVASRFGLGVDAQLVRDVQTAGSGAKWFEKQLTPSSYPDAAADAVLSWFPELRHTPQQAWANVKNRSSSAWEYGLAFNRYTMARKLLTRRHVQEVMVDFWSNLLYIPAHEDKSFPWRFDYDQMIRRSALTSYKNLLQQAVVHPAMSGWLTNYDNTKTGINENLGRELLELFTVGRAAGYSEDDVKNAARLLTGFRVKVFNGYDASYDPSAHWTGPVQVLGFSHPNSNPDGRAALRELLGYLALHPATSRRVARRLCQRFVSDTPSTALVEAVAKAYRSSGSDVKATLRALRQHPEFLASRRRLMRNPVDDIVATSRVLGLRPTKPVDDNSFVQHALWMAATAGQDQFRWPRPDGFPETTATYASSSRMIRSWQLHIALGGDWWHSSSLSRPSAAASLPARFPRRLDELVRHQSLVLVGRPTDPGVLTAVCTMLGRKPGTLFRRAKDVENWHITVIRGCILNTPQGVLK